MLDVRESVVRLLVAPTVDPRTIAPDPVLIVRPVPVWLELAFTTTIPLAPLVADFAALASPQPPPPPPVLATGAVAPILVVPPVPAFVPPAPPTLKPHEPPPPPLP